MQKKLPIILDQLGFNLSEKTFMYQDDEKLKWKNAVDAERAKSKEIRESERKVQYQKYQEEKGAEAARKKFEKEAEIERKRLAREAKLAEIKRNQTDKTFEGIGRSAFKESIDVIAQEELKEMQLLERLMQKYWEPKEIPTTLPPLVIPMDNGHKNVHESDSDLSEF